MTLDATSARICRDADLIRRIREGDDTALSTLARLYADWLFPAVLTIVKSPDFAEDVVQDVFVHLWDIRAQLSIEHVNVSAFLYRVARNRAYDLLKHERAQERLVIGLETLHGAEPMTANAGEIAIEDAEFRTAFDAALVHLQPRTREVFLMRVEQEMTYQDIAMVLGISVATAYKHVYQATKQLAQQLQMWVEGPESELNREE